MRLRHRLPGVFGLYMVDVLCCSLGCVILLWLSNDYKNALQARHIGEQKARLETLAEEQKLREKDLLRTRQELADRERQAERLSGELAVRRGELDKLGKDLFGLQDRLRITDKDRMDARASLEKTKKDLEDETKLKMEQASMARELAARRAEAEARLASLGKQMEARGALLAEREAAAKGLMGEKASLEKKLSALMEGKSASDGKIALLSRELDERAGQLARKDAMLRELSTDKAGLEKKMTAAASRAEGLEKSLADAVASAKAGKDAIASMTAAGQKAGIDLEALRRKVAMLEGALVAETASRKAAEGKSGSASMERERAEKEMKDLAMRLARLQQAAGTRFAGVQLTGRRVVLVVDASGSMELIRSDTAAPGKWPEVGRVAGLILDSLPELEKFQVVVFSESARWLLGSSGWIDYDRETSRAKVVEALSRVQPKGGTNLYEAFQTAFTLRSQGMDAVYLLSDGLPNQGEGLSERQRESLREQEKGEILGQFLRRKLRAEWNAESPGQPVVRVNTIGFFYESPELGAFLWALARENRGNFVGMNNP